MVTHLLCKPLFLKPSSSNFLKVVFFFYNARGAGGDNVPNIPWSIYIVTTHGDNPIIIETVTLTCTLSNTSFVFAALRRRAMNPP